MKQIVFASFFLGCVAACQWDSRLPGVKGSNDCSVIPEDSSICAWAAPVDAVIIGTITRLSAVDDPVAFSDGSSGSASDCVAGSQRALALDLTVEEVLFGSAPAQITLSVGPGLYAFWDPTPDIRATSSEVGWYPTDEPGQGELNIGQRIGAAAFTADSQTWGLRGRLFVASSGGVSFQSGELLCREVVPAFAGSLADFRNELAACQSDPATAEQLANFLDTSSVLAECFAERGASIENE